MVISAKIIKHPRVFRICAMCDEPLPPYRHLRLFGSAEYGDPPFVIYVHPNCAKYDKTTIAKLKASGQLEEAQILESMQSINYPPKLHSNYIGVSEM